MKTKRTIPASDVAPADVTVTVTLEEFGIYVVDPRTGLASRPKVVSAITVGCNDRLVRDISVVKAGEP